VDTKFQRRQDGALLLLNVATKAMDLVKEVSSVTPDKVVFVPQRYPYYNQSEFPSYLPQPTVL
jgi:hypothetical protein